MITDLDPMQKQTSRTLCVSLIVLFFLGLSVADEYGGVTGCEGVVQVASGVSTYYIIPSILL